MFLSDTIKKTLQKLLIHTSILDLSLNVYF